MTVLAQTQVGRQRRKIGDEREGPVLIETRHFLSFCLSTLLALGTLTLVLHARHGSHLSVFITLPNEIARL